MIYKIIKKWMYAIAKMSKKASLIFLIVLTISFLVSLTFVTYPIIILTNGVDVKPVFTIPMLIVGSVMAFLIIVCMAITSISSNYVRKQDQKMIDEKKIEQGNNLN